MNSNGNTVAWYALGVPGEVYEASSGCAFGVEEPYPHLAVGKRRGPIPLSKRCSLIVVIVSEFLATLLIMRYIAALDT